MLGYLFLFHGRMGRLQYFLWAAIFVPLIFFLAIIVLGLVLVFVVHDNSKTTIFATAGMLFVLIFWVETSLEAVRVRDIGWKPGVIIPVFIAINFIDLGVAYVAPGLADDTGLHTIVPSIVNILFMLVLLFTPTDGQEMVPFIIPGLSLPRVDLDVFRRKRPEPAVRPRSHQQQPPEERRYPREKVPFGRRGAT